MLANENRGGRRDRHLFPRKNRYRGSAQRNLGFAIADIADHQAIHRMAGCKIGADGLDRARLIGCFGKAEAGGETLIGVGGRVDDRRHAVGLFGGEPG